MKAIRILFSAIAALTIVASATAADRYPRRNITNVVAHAAGGGTDVINRIVSHEMAKVLDVNINVINKPGGSGGSTAMNYVYNKAADGYTLIGQVWSLANPVIFGGWDHKYNKAWEFFLIGGSPDVVSVPANSPFQTIEEVIDYAKKNPNKLRFNIASNGSPHHLNLLAFLKGTGIEVEQIPYPGSAPSQNAALAGEVDVVITSVAEQAELIKGGKLRALGLLTAEDEEFGGIGKISTLLNKYPDLKKYLPIPQVLGMGVKKGLPDYALKALNEAFAKAVSTEKVKNWAVSKYYVLTGETGEAATQKVNQLESLFSWTVFDLGAGKNSPADFGIPKP